MDNPGYKGPRKLMIHYDKLSSNCEKKNSEKRDEHKKCVKRKKIKTGVISETADVIDDDDDTILGPTRVASNIISTSNPPKYILTEYVNISVVFAK